MSKYNDWTRGEDEAILNIIGGIIDVARAVLRGERRLTVEELVQQQSALKPPLVGIVVKTLRLEPNIVRSHNDAIKFGDYYGHDSDIDTLFSDDQAGLAKAVSVDLVQFDRDPYYEEMLAWAKENGKKKPILPKHFYAIGAIQYTEEQYKAPIVALGSVRRGSVLCLREHLGLRYLRRDTVKGRWDRDCLFGFLNEKTAST